MSSEDVVLTLAIALAGLSLLWVLWAMVRGIRDERSPGRSVWRDFSLGLSLMVLFFVTWIAHGLAEWDRYKQDAEEHKQPVAARDFLVEFSGSTLENWQSEFLQLFAFVTLAGLYIHKGSAESKDSEEKLEAALRRIEEKLGSLPKDAPKGDEAWKLPEAPPYQA
jgi:hypothetical protein